MDTPYLDIQSVWFETVREFAKRVNLPEQLIRCMVYQGQLPHVRPKKSWVKINVPMAIHALNLLSLKTAEDLAAQMPVPIKLMPQREKRHKGRLPDKIRLAKKTQLNN